MSASVQALVSPANARLIHQNRVQGFFRDDVPSATGAESDKAKAAGSTESLSKPLRRFMSGQGSQWAEYADAEGNRYYHNTNDDQVRWARPKSAQALRRIRDAHGNAWSQHSLDGSSTFWFEERTGRVTASAAAAERELKSVKSMNGSDWYEKVDESGQSYWYNKSTGGSSLEMPELWTQESTRRHRREGGNQDGPNASRMDRKCCVMPLPCAHELPGMRVCRVPRVPGAHHSQAEVLCERRGRHTVLKVKICLYLYTFIQISRTCAQN